MISRYNSHPNEKSARFLNQTKHQQTDLDLSIYFDSGFCQLQTQTLEKTNKLKILAF